MGSLNQGFLRCNQGIPILPLVSPEGIAALLPSSDMCPMSRRLRRPRVPGLVPGQRLRLPFLRLADSLPSEPGAPIPRRDTVLAHPRPEAVETWDCVRCAS
jgi:hypothetical protein